MKKRQNLLTLIIVFTLVVGAASAQEATKPGKNKTLALAAASNPVVGGGSAGQITKWLGVDGVNTFTIGNSNIFEDKFGNVGIGTRTPTSLLTVQGMIETTLGGYKFPDGTIQTTAGIPFVIHDASLMGDGRSATPLGIALGGVQTIHLANGAVTAPKIANGTVVRSLNGLLDNVSLTGGTNITITPNGNTLTIASPNSLTSVTHDATLAGSGTAALPLGVANGGIGTAQLANNAVTLAKIAPNQVVTTLNNLNENVTLAAGSNITITPSGNMLTIAGAAGASATYHNTSVFPFVLDAPGDDVISKQVPAGSYLIFFKIDLYNNDNSPQGVSCTLNTGDSATIRLGGSGDAHGGMIVLQDIATFPAPAIITVHCTGFQIFTRKSTLTALKVDSIQ